MQKTHVKSENWDNTLKRPEIYGYRAQQNKMHRIMQFGKAVSEQRLHAGKHMQSS